jgi:DNA processing protein
MPEAKLFQLALTLVPGLGDILVKTLISYVGGAQKVFDAPLNKLTKVPGIGGSTARAIKKFDLKNAEIELERLIAKDVKLHFYTDSTYPCKASA